MSTRFVRLSLSVLLLFGPRASTIQLLLGAILSQAAHKLLVLLLWACGGDPALRGSGRPTCRCAF